MNFQNAAQLLQIFILAFAFIVFLLYAYLSVRRTSSRSVNYDRFDELYLRIKDDIKYAVAPHFVDLSVGVKEFSELANEIWRIEQRINKIMPSLSEGQRTGLISSSQKLKRSLERFDFEIIDYTNQKFNDGLNLDVLSVEKDPNADCALIKETVEPTIIYKGQVIKKAKVIIINK